MGVGIKAEWSTSAVSADCSAGEAYLRLEVVDSVLDAGILVVKGDARERTRGVVHVEHREGARARRVREREAMSPYYEEGEGERHKTRGGRDSTNIERLIDFWIKVCFR